MDLKPENVILQENGYLKIIDFNTAKQYEQGRDSDTVIIGTRKYAAPEQFGYRQSDVRTDIYAMGVMMNYLLTKNYPDEYLYCDDKAGKISMQSIIRKCTEFSPDHRYQTVMELRDDLQAALAKMNRTDLKNIDHMQTSPSTKRGLWKNPLLPPGFRTGVVWKMILAGIGYWFVFWLSFSLEVKKTDGTVMTGFYLWANRLTFLIWALLTIAFYADYLGFQKHLPLMQRKYLRWIGYLLWPTIFLFVLIMILVIIGG